MLAATQEPGPIAILAVFGGLFALLAVLIAGRRAGARHELRTVCLLCGSVFQGVGRMNFVGFREMTCSSCGKTALYPMPKWMVRTYVALLIIASGAIVVAAVTDPDWAPHPGGLWILVLPVALFVNRALWRKLRVAAGRAPGNPVPMERVAPGSPAAFL